MNYVYTLPDLKGSNRFVKGALGGWQLSGFTRFESGAPFGVGYSITGVSQQNITGSPTKPARVRILGNPYLNTSGGPYNRINAAAFAAPQVGSIGLESGVNYLTGPGVNDWDISLQKSFTVKERLKFQFRADAFNAFNHAQFTGVNSTLNFASLTNPNPTNLYLKSDGTVNNINGFGTINGAADPRIMQLVIRMQF